MSVVVGADCGLERRLLSCKVVVYVCVLLLMVVGLAALLVCLIVLL